MTQRSLTLLVWLCAALAAACGGDSGVGPTSAAPDPAPEPVLARLEVTPDSSLLTLGEDQRLTINAWDQFGARLFGRDDWATAATYVISDSAVARLYDGMLTGLALGVARITASLTINDRTLTDSMTVQVVMPTATSAVIALDQYGYWWYGSPYAVSLKAPAVVTWVVPGSVQAPAIWLTLPSANPEMLALVNGVATRTLSTPGNYYYGTAEAFEWHEIGGVVRVF